jgi:cell division septum initiation protein DivIVA
LRREIEDTRRDLSHDVDALTEKVSPQRVVERKVDKTKAGLAGMKDKVMGSAHSAASFSGDSASGVADTAGNATSTVKQKAEGNPLAAGLVAFGIGWLVSSLLPASEKETELASTVTDKVKESAQPVKDELGSVATEMKDNLAGPAQEAAESVKSTAQQAASTVQEDTKSAASDVKDEAGHAGETVKKSSSSSSSASPSGSGTPSVPASSTVTQQPVVPPPVRPTQSDR